jgi:hypothetical protein
MRYTFVGPIALALINNEDLFHAYLQFVIFCCNDSIRLWDADAQSLANQCFPGVLQAYLTFSSA